MPLLRPGEIKILTTLQKGPKLFKDLHTETGLSPNALSPYLKNLQKEGLVERDIQNYKRPYYILKDISIVSLLFNEMIAFMRDHLETTINEDLKKGVSLTRLPEAVALDWIILTNNSDLRKIISDELKKDLQTQMQLMKISSKIEDFWKAYLLDREKPKQRKIIENYRNYLLEIVKLSFSKEWQSNEKKVYEDYKKIEKKELEQSYPGVVIPERMIQINADKRMEQNKRIDNQFWQPDTVIHMCETIDRLNRLKLTREDSDLTPDENKKFEEMVDFLTKHRKYYESFVSRIKQYPKTLLIYPSWGFSDYPKKFAKIAKEFV